MAKSRKETRKAFVQARLAATGKEATPEQLAQFRQRFQALSQSVEGRTKIAQQVLPGGTAAERKALKKMLRETNPMRSTSAVAETGDDSAGGTPKPVSWFETHQYPPRYGQPKPTTPSGVAPTTSTTIPKSTTSTTIPKSTTSTTIPRTTTTTTPKTITATTVPKTTTTSTTPVTQPGKIPPGVFESFGPKHPVQPKTPSKDKNIGYGNTWEEKVALNLEKWNVPIFGMVAGIGRDWDQRKYFNAALKTAAAVGIAAVTRASFGAAATAGKPVWQKSSTTGATNQTSLRLEYEQYTKDIAKLQNQKFGQTQGLMGHTTPGGIRAESSVQALQGRLGGAKDYPVRSVPRTHLGESKFATDQASGATGPAFGTGRRGIDIRDQNAYVQRVNLEEIEAVGAAKPPQKTPKTTATTVPKVTATTVPQTTVTTKSNVTKIDALSRKNHPTARKSPSTTVPKVTATTVPKTTATTVPKTTATTVPVSPPTTVPMRYTDQGKRIGPFQDIRPGDPKPIKPKKPSGMSRVKWDLSDEVIDYEIRLENYLKYLKKK